MSGAWQPKPAPQCMAPCGCCSSTAEKERKSLKSKACTALPVFGAMELVLLFKPGVRKRFTSVLVVVPRAMDGRAMPLFGPVSS